MSQSPRKPRQKSLSIPIGASVPSGSMERYFKIPDWLFMDNTVGWGAKLVYAVINRFSDTYTFPVGGYAFIQEILDISRAQLFRRLDELEVAGFINREKSTTYARRIQIMPRHNALAQAFYEAEDGAFERFKVFRKSLTSETLRKNQESHPCDSTTIVMSHPCDTNSLTSETLPEVRPYCIREPLREPLKNENQDFFSSSDQSQNPNPLSTEESLLAEETPLAAPAELCDKNYFLGKTYSYELHLDTEVCDFVTLAYRQRSKREMDATKKYIPGKLSSQQNAHVRLKIEEAERKISAVEFRLALWCYLDTESNSLRTDKWPLHYFLKEPLRYLPEIPHWPPSDRPTQSPRTVPTRTSSEALADAPAQFYGLISDPSKNPLTYINMWNTIVYDSPVDVDSVPGFTMAGLKKAISGGDFPKCFERVFEKCQRMNTNKPDTITFDGLFMGFIPMWQKIYSGTEDWKMGKADPFASVLAAAEREERGGV